ncbi:hypothetical protein [Floridanema aerugineum]|uniref:Uncharacterized protein n=1 Tax=Floridaenema aerugineum BLCC-F46 TaxID=3153654 RepID=A0ABV4XGZ1_9CYAN
MLNDKIDLIVLYCQKMNYRLFTGKDEKNIIYVEGMDVEGNFNNDAPNQFNDVRLVLSNDFHLLGNWSATTEPGRFYTEHPMNPKGAARIAFGQYKAWAVGMHGNSQPHEALIQVAEVMVYRDSNKDGLRIGDGVDRGLFGINQHWGYDLPPDNIGRASAGCLVGRTRKGHLEFMSIVKTDPRYQADRRFLFTTTIIPGDQL